MSNQPPQDSFGKKYNPTDTSYPGTGGAVDAEGRKYIDGKMVDPGPCKQDHTGRPNWCGNHRRSIFQCAELFNLYIQRLLQERDSKVVAPDIGAWLASQGVRKGVVQMGSMYHDLQVVQIEGDIAYFRADPLSDPDLSECNLKFKRGKTKCHTHKRDYWQCVQQVFSKLLATQEARLHDGSVLVEEYERLQQERINVERLHESLIEGCEVATATGVCTVHSRPYSTCIKNHFENLLAKKVWNEIEYCPICPKMRAHHTDEEIAKCNAAWDGKLINDACIVCTEPIAQHTEEALHACRIAQMNCASCNLPLGEHTADDLKLCNERRQYLRDSELDKIDSTCPNCKRSLRRHTFRETKHCLRNVTRTSSFQKNPEQGIAPPQEDMITRDRKRHYFQCMEHPGDWNTAICMHCGLPPSGHTAKQLTYISDSLINIPFDYEQNYTRDSKPEPVPNAEQPIRSTVGCLSCGSQIDCTCTPEEIQEGVKRFNSWMMDKRINDREAEKRVCVHDVPYKYSCRVCERSTTEKPGFVIGMSIPELTCQNCGLSMASHERYGKISCDIAISMSTPEPPPKRTDGPKMWDLVIEDMKERDRVGTERYGTPLQAFNGRKPLVDAYQEALDQVVYLRQEIEEDQERGQKYDDLVLRCSRLERELTEQTRQNKLRTAQVDRAKRDIHEAEQALGKALGYPELYEGKDEKDEKVTCGPDHPGATPTGMISIGDHTVVTLAREIVGIHKRIALGTYSFEKKEDR